MKSIRDIQYENAMVSYVNLLRLYSESPSMPTIEKIVSNVEYSTDKMPMSGNYRLEPYVTINDRYLNSELELIRADSNTITTYLKTIEEYLRTAEYVSDTWCQLAKSFILRAKESLFTYTSDVISGSTKILNIRDVIDTSITTMNFENGFIVPKQSLANSASVVFSDQDISIKPTSLDSINTITGSKTSVFNPSEYGNLTLDAEMKSISECGFTITIDKNIPQVNTLVIEFLANTKGIRISVDISPDGRSYTNVFNKVCWDKRAVIPFGSSTDISAAKISITSNVPSIVSDSSAVFEFKIHKISFANIKNAISNVFQTKRIPIDANVKMIAAVVDGDISNAEMTVKLSTDADDNGNAVGFVAVSSLKNGTMHLDTKSTSMSVISNTDSWNMVNDSTYSSSVYNLFSVVPNGTIDNADYTIEDGKLVFNDASMSIIPESITLYRGVKDFLKSEIDIVSEHTVANVLHSTEYLAFTKWFASIDLKIPYTEIVTPSSMQSINGAKNNAFIVSFLVTNPEQIKIVKDDGTEFSAFAKAITKQSNGTYLIEFMAASNSNLFGYTSSYKVTYITTIEELYTKSDSNIAVDISSFKVSVGTTALRYGDDYTINQDLWKLVLLKTGQYADFMDVDTDDPSAPINNSPDLVVSFKYNSTPKETIYKYSSYVYCSSETDIVIKPFSADEVAQGNFHRINGTDVSQLTGFTLNIGENYIETTQPHASFNDYDLNAITQNACSAAVIIPDNVDNMYAYKDSMRQISPFILGTLNRKDGSKCFSFDNGKILLNFQPDFVDPVIFVDETQSAQEGELFTCKKPTYDSSYINNGYVAQPEIFEVSFSYKSDSARYIAIRIEVECDSPDSYVNISRVGLNELKED